nr:CbbQ/NirQ/NorQ C-terminal domain-containing protein [Deltaproteobacteria bacterium]
SGLGWVENHSGRPLRSDFQLILSGIASRRACELAVAGSITDDPETERAVEEIIHSIFDK